MLAVTLTDPQQKALAYFAVLAAMALVAVNVPPGTWLFKWIIGPLLKGVGKTGRGLLKYAWRSTKELAAYLGYEGRRFLIFVGGLFFLLWTFQIFGGWFASKFATVFLIFALSTRKRRLVRNSKFIRHMDARLDEFGKKLDKKLDGIPSPKEAKVNYQEWRRSRSTTSTGVDPATGTVTAEAMNDPDYFNRRRPAWDSFREAMRKRKDQP